VVWLRAAARCLSQFCHGGVVLKAGARTAEYEGMAAIGVPEHDGVREIAAAGGESSNTGANIRAATASTDGGKVNKKPDEGLFIILGGSLCKILDRDY
jgi:hypothetical protein